MPAVEKSTSRNDVMVPVISRPRILIVMLSPMDSPISSASSAAKLIWGVPVYPSGHHWPSVMRVFFEGVSE